METIKSNRVSKKFKLLIKFKPQIIFPLICPEREKEWVDGWKYKMIYSASGFIEADCTYSTVAENGAETIWYVIAHDKEKFTVEFLRLTPKEMIVRTNIKLQDAGNGNTLFDLTNEYTMLNTDEGSRSENELTECFTKSMVFFGDSLVRYLESMENAKSK